jgi:hypothetical protein
MRCGLRRVSAGAPTPILALYPPRRRSCQKIMSPFGKIEGARRRTCTATLARKQRLIRARSVDRRLAAFNIGTGKKPARSCAALGCAVGEQFAVLLFFDNGKHKYARRFVSAQEACRVFEKCIHSVDARLGIRTAWSLPTATTAFCASGSFGSTAHFSLAHQYGPWTLGASQTNHRRASDPPQGTNCTGRCLG